MVEVKNKLNVMKVKTSDKEFHEYEKIIATSTSVAIIPMYSLQFSISTIIKLCDMLNKNKVIKSLELQFLDKNLQQKEDFYIKVASNIALFIEKNRSLNCLNLSNNKLKDCIQIIVKAIIKVNILKTLILKNTKLYDDSSICLIELIEESKSLKHLDVSDSNLRNENINKMLKAAEYNDSLETLNVQTWNGLYVDHNKTILLGNLNSNLINLNIKYLKVDLDSISKCFEGNNILSLENLEMTINRFDKTQLSRFSKALNSDKNSDLRVKVHSFKFALNYDEIHNILSLLVNCFKIVEFKADKMNCYIECKNVLAKYILYTCKINHNISIFKSLNLNISEKKFTYFLHNKMNRRLWIKENLDYIYKKKHKKSK